MCKKAGFQGGKKKISDQKYPIKSVSVLPGAGRDAKHELQNTNFMKELMNVY
jgi:hypothetical protein